MKSFFSPDFLKLGVIFVLSLVCTTCTITHVKSPRPPTIRYLQPRVVYVRTSKGVNGGTGVVLRNHLVLTAEHVVTNHSTVLVERYDKDGKKLFSSRAHVVKVDEKNDLALLNVEKSLGVRTRIAKRVSLGESVITLGFPYDRDSKKRTYLSYSKGKVNTVTDKRIRFDANVFFGSSGGPVFNKRGRVISVVQKGYSYFPAYYGVRPKVIRKFLKKVKLKGRW